jgi:hypothetical protein
MSAVKCWHCGRTVDTSTGLFDIIPVSTRRKENGALVFEGPGIFHFNMQCLLAYVYDLWQRLPTMNGIQAHVFEPMHLRGTLLTYARERHRLARLPPPHPSRLLLEEFGGPFTWTQWRDHSWKHADQWELAEYVRAESANLLTRPDESVLIEQRPLVVTKVLEKHVPGRTDALAGFILK